MQIEIPAQLILDNQQITCQQIAETINVTVGTVNKIIDNYLNLLKFSKVSACCVPRQLSAFVWQRS